MHRHSHERPRRSRGWRTPAQAGRPNPPWNALVDRATFYLAAHCAIARAVVGCSTKRELRQANRQARLETMELIGLITRTRGDAWGPASSLDN
jgi:hypothetical protein